MRSAFIFILILSCAALASGRQTVDTVYRLAETSVPLAARQEKAQSLLQTWEMIAPAITVQFRLNGEEDLAIVQDALDVLLAKEAVAHTTTSVPMYADHHLVWSLVRSQMVNSLNFSEPRLRHFLHLNQVRYPCEPSATVSELLVPDTYINSAGTTAILDEIAERLKKESFPRMVYHVNDQLGKHGTGYRGDVTPDKAGADRFELYRQTLKNGQTVGGSGDKVGGPYRLADGWLYVQVHSLIDGPEDCFRVYKQQIAQDYGREWLKKIYQDTLTTATNDLKPDINRYTTGTALTDIAFTVNGHSMTFGQARVSLPYLMGNEGDPRFWASIQRQALELQLIYHGAAGETIRKSPEYEAHQRILAYLAMLQDKLHRKLNPALTTSTVEAWFADNRHRFTSFGAVTFESYICDTPGSLISPESRAECAAVLAKLTKSDAQVDPGTNRISSLGIPILKNTVSSPRYDDLRRETQVALQSLSPGEWSPVYMENGRPRIVRLVSIQKVEPKLADIRDRVWQEYVVEYQLDFWRKVFQR